MHSKFPYGKTVLFCVTVVSLLACSTGEGFFLKSVVAASSSAPDPPKTSVEDQVLPAVSKGLRRAGLLDRADQCYAYRFEPGRGQRFYAVDVMENHQHPECGGDPQTQPHLFTVHVNKKTRGMSTDIRSPGDFVPLKP